MTPSSKCVGDLAIYLVTRGLSVADVLDEGKAAGIDFPASVIELLEGRLGFPHRGFPVQVGDKREEGVGFACYCLPVIQRRLDLLKLSCCSSTPPSPSLPPSTQVQKSILKGRPPLSVAPSAALAPADFAAEKTKLDSKWGIDATPEDVISSLLYPKVNFGCFSLSLVFTDQKRDCADSSAFLPYPDTFLPPSLPQVFADYQKFLSTHGPGPRFLPTPSFYYGMEIGKESTQTFSLPSSLGE